MGTTCTYNLTIYVLSEIYRGYSNFLLNMTFISSSEVENIFIIYKVVKYKKILLIYIVYFIFSLVKI